MNGPSRAAFWADFILSRSDYPAPDRLLAHLYGAKFSDFCDCGCNSFAVTVGSGVPPLAPADGRYGSVFEAEFMMEDGRTLEIILFANEGGNLAYVEVDCCANNYPVPDSIEANERPFRTSSSDGLFM